MFNHLETPRSKKKKKEEEEKNSVCLQNLQNDESFLFKVRIILDQLSYIFYRHLMIRLISSLICLLVLRNKKLIRFGRFAVKWRSFECRGGKK